MRAKDRIPGVRVSLVRDAGAPAHPQYGRVADVPTVAAEIARAFIPAGDEREHFVALYVDSRSKVKGVCVVSIGTISASLVHPREVFRPAIVAGAAAVIVAHNHPSGDVTPSHEDKDATRRLARAGALLGVPLLDHVIVTNGGDSAQARHFSFREGGIL